MRLIVVRHGQSTCNIPDLWHGWDQCELTDLGKSQARAAAERLGDEPIAGVYCSDLRRAIQTAEAIAAPHGLTPVQSPAFRERNAGEFEGSIFEEVMGAHPEAAAARKADYWDWSPPGGESFREMLDRVLTGVKEIRAQHEKDTVVVVGHMGTVRVLMCRYTGMTIEESYEMDLVSTGLCIYDLDGDRVTVERLNDGAHAAGIA
jgi:broad specificity phosphatase PhoE